MTFYVENESEIVFQFDVENVIKTVGEYILKLENCNYPTQLNVLITDNKGIQGYNKQFRDLDKETDVLSFPNLFFEEPGKFQIGDAEKADCFDLDTDELILGDIIISAEKVVEQADNYNHSLKREFAFLIAHSVLHLCGYDHMEQEEAKIMEDKQKRYLDALEFTRERTD